MTNVCPSPANRTSATGPGCARTTPIPRGASRSDTSNSRTFPSAPATAATSPLTVTDRASAANVLGSPPNGTSTASPFSWIATRSPSAPSATDAGPGHSR